MTKISNDIQNTVPKKREFQRKKGSSFYAHKNHPHSRFTMQATVTDFAIFLKENVTENFGVRQRKYFLVTHIFLQQN